MREREKEMCDNERGFEVCGEVENENFDVQKEKKKKGNDNALLNF